MSTREKIYLDDVVKEWAEEEGLNLSPVTSIGGAEKDDANDRCLAFREQRAGTEDARIRSTNEIAIRIMLPGVDEAVGKMERLVSLLKEAQCLRNELFGS